MYDRPSAGIGLLIRGRRWGKNLFFDNIWIQWREEEQLIQLHILKKCLFLTFTHIYDEMYPQLRVPFQIPLPPPPERTPPIFMAPLSPSNNPPTQINAVLLNGCGIISWRMKNLPVVTPSKRMTHPLRSRSSLFQH